MQTYYNYKNVLIEKTEPVLNARSELFWVQKNFIGDPIGKCRVYYRDGKLYGDFELQIDCKGMYPSISYMAGVDGKGYRLLGVAVCTQPNLDREIKPL